MRMADYKWDLSRLSAGERSALKRSAGVMLHVAGAAAAEAFYRAMPGVKRFEEDACFAAMCMQCLWRDGEKPRIKLLPEMLRGIYQNPDATESSRRKCTAFLDLSWDDDGFLLGKICSLVKGMRSKDASVIPDFESLAEDLVRWNHPDRYIQRKWLRTICSMNENEQKEEEEENVD